MKNILSIDLESWVYFGEKCLGKKDDIWRRFPAKKRDNGYIIEATARMLDLLEGHHQKATFFILGEIHEWYPDLVQGIRQKGHEVAYHTHSHKEIRDKKVLEHELERSEHFIRCFRPIGFRAPRIYITEESMEVLRAWGFRYSSSSYSSHGMARFQGVDEIPISAISLKGMSKRVALPGNLSVTRMLREIPIGSGLFLGLSCRMVSLGVRDLNRRGRPAVLFIHPWQIFRPKAIEGLAFKAKVLVRGPLRFPYTRNITKGFSGLLKRHQFTSFKEYYYT